MCETDCDLDDSVKILENYNEESETEFDELICRESLDQMSPKIWIDKGMREMIADNTPIKQCTEHREWRELTTEDMDLLTTFSNMKPSEILTKIEDYLNLAFELGIEEEKEITRGRIIDVFSEYKQKNL